MHRGEMTFPGRTILGGAGIPPARLALPWSLPPCALSGQILGFRSFAPGTVRLNKYLLNQSKGELLSLSFLRREQEMPQAAAEGFRLNWQWVRQICFPWRLCCPESPEAVKSLISSVRATLVWDLYGGILCRSGQRVDP